MRTYLHFILFILFNILSIISTSAQLTIAAESAALKASLKSAEHVSPDINISKDQIRLFHKNIDENIVVHFNLNENKMWQFNLRPASQNHNKLDVVIKNSPENISPVKNLKITSYIGTITDDPDTKVFMTIVGDKLELKIIDHDKSQVLYWSERHNAYSLQISENTINNKFKLGCKNHTENEILNQIDSQKKLKSTNTCQEIDLQFYTDYLFFHNNNKSIEEALINIVSLTNQIQEDYLLYNIQFNLTKVLFSTCEDCDPWTNSQEASHLLSDFRSKTEPTIDNTIKILFTGRSLNNLFIGLAKFQSICTDKALAVIQQIPNSSWEQRVILSHELGHVLGAIHDDSNMNIMSSSLNNTSEWSSGSISKIQTTISNSNCLQECIDYNCPNITDISVVEINSNQLSIEWESNISTSASYSLTIVGTNEIISSGTIHTSILTFENLSGCEEYELTIQANCNVGESTSYSKIISSSSLDKLVINDIQVLECNEEYVDLRLQIDPHDFENTELEILIGQEQRIVNINSQTNFIDINNIQNLGQLDTKILISEMINNQALCISKRIYDMPTIDCKIQCIEDFNSNTLPDFWSIESTNTEYYVSPYMWKFENSERGMSNYAYTADANNGYTINGTRMACIDDDYLSYDSYTGSTYILSPIFHLSHYSDIHISFDYIFDKFSEKGDNESLFRMDAWSGTEWIEVFIGEETTCPWFNIWKNDCSVLTDLDLSQFNHDSFQLRFVYSDGNNSKWTGMAAFDNFNLTASKPRFGCLDITAINFKESANTHLQNLCLYTCEKDYMFVNEYSNNMDIQNINRIDATGIIDNSNSVNLTGQRSVTLTNGFSVAEGASVTVDTKQCIRN